MVHRGGWGTKVRRPVLSGARPSRWTALVAGVLGCSVLLSGAWSATAVAQEQEGPEAPGPGVSGPETSGEFVKGAAAARADTLKVAGQVGGLDIGMTLGRSLANYQGTFAVGEGRALDLEALPFLVGEVTACEGVTPLIPDAALPELTLVESTQEGSEGSHRTQTFFPEVKGGPSEDPAGWQDASSSDQPWATASTETPTQWMDPLFTLHNPTTEVTAQLVDGVREATAVMTADELSVAGGLLTLRDLRWEATARSGGEEVTAGSFTVSSGTSLGLYRTPEQALADLAAFGDAFSRVLGFVGAALDMPKVILEEDRVEVTPLVFRFTDLPIGRDAISPLLDFFGDSVEKFYEDLRASGCEGESTAQILQIVEDLVRGNGSVVIPVGGVIVSTDDTYVEPFSFDLPEEEPGDDPAPPPEAPRTADPQPFDQPFDAGLDPVDLGFDLPLLESFDLDPGFAAGDFSTADLGPGAFEAEPIETSPVSASAPAAEDEPATSESALGPSAAASTNDGARGGAAMAVGVLTVLAAIVLALSDRSTMLRGRKRVIPDG